jgi:hypothetical protein
LPKINGGYFLNSTFNNESGGDYFSAGSETGTDKMSDHTENDDENSDLILQVTAVKDERMLVMEVVCKGFQ